MHDPTVAGAGTQRPVTSGRQTGDVLVEAQGVRRSLGGEVVLRGVDLAVRSGSIHALVGMNGAGKTTLMRIMLGMLSADGGRASLFGIPVGALPAARWREVGQMIETPAIYPELTARENITAAALLHGMDRAALPDSVQTVAENLGMERWLDQRGKRLSLGTRQKVALACALVHRPTVLVLDEPSNSLDPSAVVRLRESITGVAERGGAVLVSSHHLDELARLAETVTVLHRGRIVGGLDPRGFDLERAFFDLIYQADQDHPGEAA
ncbi:ABC transporter ATP-binding protein [Streptomyces sp. 8N114]|uniref:ABC transporter ATP-binding protein n=1 Tax=Streptomyces sp. 8N114 TaxID=3457419 RepID=UPI003FD2C092